MTRSFDLLTEDEGCRIQGIPVKDLLTATNDFATTRPAYRWKHLVALARVTASEAGQISPGYAEACGLLKIDA